MNSTFKFLSIVSLFVLVATAAFAFHPAPPKGDGADQGAGPGYDAVELAINAALFAPDSAWLSPMLKDCFMMQLESAKNMAADGFNNDDSDQANQTLDTAAQLVNISIGKVDGNAGEFEDAHLDDWILNDRVKCDLYGKLIQAQNDILRIKRQ